MYFRSACLSALLTLFLLIKSTLQYEIYVDNQAVSSANNGSATDPFLLFSDSLVHVSKNLDKTTKITIYLVPSPKPYLLEDFKMNFHSSKVPNLTITTLNNSQTNETLYSRASLHLDNSNLTFTLFGSLNFTEINVFQKTPSVIKMTRGSVIFNGIIWNQTYVNQTFSKSESFITIENGESVLVQDFYLWTMSGGTFLKYSGSLPFMVIPDLILRNIKINFIKDSMDIFTHLFFSFESSLIYTKRNFLCQNFTFNLDGKKDGQSLYTREIPALFYLYNIWSVTFNGLYIEDQTFSLMSSKLLNLAQAQYVELNDIVFRRNTVGQIISVSIFSLKDVKDLVVTNLDFSGNTISESSAGAKNTLQFFQMSLITAVKIANHKIIGNQISHKSFQIFNFAFSKTTSVNFDLNVAHITISKNKNDVGVSGDFSFIAVQDSTIQSTVIDDVTFSENSLSGRIFRFQTFNQRKNIFVEAPLQLNISRINIINNPSNDTNFLYFLPISTIRSTFDCIQVIEPFNIWIDQLKVLNNTFNKGTSLTWIYEISLFYVKETQVNITNSEISHNNFTYYDFLTLDKKPSTVTFSKNQVYNNSFTTSKLINTDNIAQNSYCRASGDQVSSPNTILYRYAFVMDSHFTLLNLTTSTLFILNNGFFIFKDNVLDKIKLYSESTILSSSFTSVVNSETNMNPLAYLEELTFGRLPQAYEVYTQTKELISPYSAYMLSFYRMSGNKFTNIINFNTKFISLSGYGSKESVILIEDNEFHEIEFKQSQLNSQFEINGAEALVIHNNSWKKVNKQVAIFSVSHNQATKHISVTSNKLNETDIAGFFMCSASRIINLNFERNAFNYSAFSKTYVSINTQLAINDWLFDSNIVQTVVFQTLSERAQVEKYSIFTIFVGDASETNVIHFRNTLIHSFYTHSGFDYGMLSEISMFGFEAHQKVTFTKLFCTNITMQAPGSLLHIAYSPQLSLIQSEFRAIIFQSKYGLIHTCAANVRILESTFYSLTNRERSGILVLSSSISNYTITLHDNTLEKVGTNSIAKQDIPDAGTFVSAIYLPSVNSDVKSAVIKLEMVRCRIINIDHGYVIHMGVYKCADCILQDNYFFIDDETTVSSAGLVNLYNNAYGLFVIDNLRMHPNTSTIAPMIRITNCKTDFRISNLRFTGIGKPLSLLFLDSGKLTIKDSFITKAYFKNLALIHVVPSPTYSISGSAGALPAVTLENTNFTEINYPRADTGFSQVLLQSLQYNYDSASPTSTKSVIFSVMPGTIDIKNCIFENFTCTPAIFLADILGESLVPNDNLSVRISNSNFTNINSSLGTAISSLKKRTNNSEIIIKDCNFVNNSALVGGAIAVMTTKLNITDSLFLENKAKQAGAAIFTQYPLSEMFSKKNVDFIKNIAEYPGDTISDSVSSKVTFVSDSSQPLGLQIEEDTTKGVLKLKRASTADLHKGHLVISFLDQMGQPAFDFSVVKDAYFEIPKKDSSGGTISDTFPAQLEWVNDRSVNVSMKEIILKGQAWDTVTVYLRYISDRLKRMHPIEIEIRPCVAGEYNSSSSCESCEPLTYSLNSSQPCASCPINANCHEQNKVCPNPGYWNPDPEPGQEPDKIYPCRSDNIFRCVNEKDKCKSCLEGYQGPLCNACDFESGYVEGGYLKCGKCEDPKKSLMLALLGALLYMFYQLFSINTVYSANKLLIADGRDYLAMRKTERSYYMKSLLSYIQIMSVLYMTSSQIYKSFGLFSQVGNPSSLIIYGTQCSLKALGFSYKNYIYDQTWMIVGAPYVQFIAIIIFLGIISLCSKKKKGSVFSEKIFIACIYIVMSYQPGIVTNLGLFLSCSTLPGLNYSYIASHPYWKCDSPEYLNFSRLVAVPSLILWGAIVPIIIFFILFFNRHNLRTEKMRKSFGVMFLDLKTKYFYWGIILMLLKVSLSVLAYGLEHRGEVPIFIALLLLWAYQTLLRVIKPYKTDAYNNFEITLMNLLMFNIIVARYLLVPSNHSIITDSALVLTLILNGGFLVMLLWKVLSLTSLSVLAFVEKKLLKRNVSRDTEAPLMLNDHDGDKAKI